MSISTRISFTELDSLIGSLVHKKETLVGWQTPLSGWVTLNTNGAFQHSIRKATTSGVIRCHEGFWINGFVINLGLHPSYRVELWGENYGLKLAWESRIRKLWHQVDNKMDLLTAIQEMLQRQWEVKVTHVYCEANTVSDFLANLGFSFDVSYVAHNTPAYWWSLDSDSEPREYRPGIATPRISDQSFHHRVYTWSVIKGAFGRVADIYISRKSYQDERIIGFAFIRVVPIKKMAKEGRKASIVDNRDTEKDRVRAIVSKSFKDVVLGNGIMHRRKNASVKITSEWSTKPTKQSTWETKSDGKMDEQLVEKGKNEVSHQDGRGVITINAIIIEEELTGTNFQK
ncbi:Uncharacterized protein TCM_019420 [Theobroma cacao]|uniref:RNase H type-1 domain-containing protein n=1 Tax=Theobroma cacao TaxID=3641 RepID=A0A061EPC8_THECC|nr:Uncharacterized protein TCM_019420 [Theobroma cacao]